MFEVILGSTIAAAIISFAYIAINLDREKHGALSIFFIVLSILTVLIGLNLAAETADHTDIDATMASNILTQAYSPFIYIVILVIGYFLIFFIDNIMKKLAQDKLNKDKKGDY